jgi:hypothetical protein
MSLIVYVSLGIVAGMEAPQLIANMRIGKHF